MKKEKLKITKSCGNVFLDLGFSPEEATILAMRSQLMGELSSKSATWNGHRPRPQKYSASHNPASPT